MSLEIKYRYNEDDFRQRLILFRELHFKQEKDKLGNYVVFLVMSILFGVAFLYFDSDRSGIVIGPILLMVALVYTIALIRFFIRKKRYEVHSDEGIEETIKRLNESSGIIRYTFSDDYFFYSDDYQETKLKWNMLHSYLLTDQYLFVISNTSSPSAYTLSATDISRSQFIEVCAFVKTKLSPYSFQKSLPEKKQGDTEILDDSLE